MKTHILLIEDNEQNSYLIRFLLEKNGCQVEVAQDGQEGINRAKQHPPSAIILDIQLPVMDGFEVLKHLRQHQTLTEVPIVAVTSYAMEGDRERILAAGCCGYIEKPINPDTFAEDLGRTLPFPFPNNPGDS